jgi:RNA polymerase sigma-70 factor (ECF subfamily)
MAAMVVMPGRAPAGASASRHAHGIPFSYKLKLRATGLLGTATTYRDPMPSERASDSLLILDWGMRQSSQAANLVEWPGRALSMAKVPQEPSVTSARLDELTTQWSLLRLAHEQSVTGVGTARSALALRYAPAIRSYVGAQVKDAHDADELAQEVVVKILHGDFARAVRERGRFRDLLKVAVRNLVRNYWTRKNRRGRKVVDTDQLADLGQEDPFGDQALNASWRDSVLQMTWAALKTEDRAQPNRAAATLLRLRVDDPEADTVQLAARLEAATGRSLKPDAVRQQLRRARLRFAQLLVEEIARGLDDATPANVEEELGEVGLLEYVRDFLPPDWGTRGELRDDS